MPVMFRSSDVPRREREDAVKSAFLDHSWPQDVEIAGSPDAVMEACDFGHTSLFQAHLRSMSLSRSAQQIRTHPADMITIARQTHGVAHHDQFHRQQVVRPGELMVVDMDAPYRFGWGGAGGSQAIYLPREDLGLSREVIAQAATRLSASPLYGLFRTHVADLAAVKDSIATSPAAPTLDVATADLARALLASAHQPDRRHSTPPAVMVARIRGYARNHLSDPTLSPSSIARAHGISTRTLFRLCESADLRLEEWIIARRLAGSREELSRRETRDVPIGLVAQRWGFSSPSHFARRFRSEYGVTPRDWRRSCAGSWRP